MPGFPLTAGSVLCCLHQAPTTTAVTQQAVTILRQPVTTVVPPINVIGCPFATAAPQPCLTILWEMASTKVTVQGQPLRLMPPPGAGPGPGKCLGPAPQGIPDMKSNQTKVIVT